ncbi:FG-GAP-like repeat-containing protein [Aliifodinibius sp. S!AR15-10]|uniref:FG-GAP-like repeat-containing protein n=1 Tax=Aliifodinibius sp. S!AR15-10 TaxID=2950437 RepID=UPI00285ABAF7|nr:FG-GAP-like repeat-containing protein [Aliifodinibius sp. S!AR15-10]MDR8390083.1 FG-GAP-like repeat-containing protein [Aliifodinibius sp. S!AR15-10]
MKHWFQKKNPVVSASGISIVVKTGFILLICLFTACNFSSNLEWKQEKYHRWAEVDPGYFGETGFESLSPSETNINFENQITDQQIAENRHYLNGSGVAAGDVDGDGLTDLYFTGLNTPNKLYKNMGGMQFEDITDKAGVAHNDYYSTGAVFADIDGDEDLDLLVSAMHKENVLYINDGSGNFTHREDSGLGAAKGSMTMALADIDSDGDLDLYITNYKEKSVKDIYTTEELEWNNLLKEPYNEQNQTGPFTLVPPFDQHYQLFMSKDNRLVGAAETGEEDELYINEGGSFQKVQNTEDVFRDASGDPMGLQPDWGLTAKFQDLNDDGLPDLYVCNDFFPKDRIWINQGDGTFREMDWRSIRNMSFSAMAVDFSDINRDGQLDMFVTEMLSPKHERRLRQMGSDDPTPNRTDSIQSQPQYNRNSMYLKREDDTYAEISYLSNTEATEWSWATRFMDIDLDGYEDLIVNTGYTYDILDIDTQAGMIKEGRNMDENFDVLVERAPKLDLANKFLQNNGDLTFQDRSTAWGFGETDVSHGLATADLDNDGDLDFASNRLNNTAAVFENLTNAGRIAVKLRGDAPNYRGIGAKIRLVGGDLPQEKQLSAGGDYLSGSTPTAMFAADEAIDYRIEVTWPDGAVSTIEDVQANRIYEIDNTGASEPDKTQAGAIASSEPIFEDISNQLGHRHHEDPFDESKLQPLLPGKMSKLGPGITWLDIDRDGDDDLLVASGKGGTMGAFENLGEGSFHPMKGTPFDQTVPGDQTTLLGWKTGESINLVAGSANYEQGSPQVPSAFQYRFSGSGIEQVGTLSNYSTTGTMAAADFDNDGDIDLFLAGRFVPAHYPRNATSRLFKNENGSFVVDQVNSRKLGEIGLVTGAVFSDYDRDGDQDLLISREWDSILIMENDGGTFNNVSEKVGLARYNGWWNGIATGDFNNDGRPDIVAANIGLNSTYQMKNGKPLRMYYSDFNGDRRVDILETHANSDGNYVPRKKLFQYNSLPIISNQFQSYRAFGQTNLQEIFGNRLSRMPFKEINTLQHMLFINTGEGFEAKPLPPKAQFSAGFHVGVADYNNDGNEDLFMSQNYFGMPREVPRLDAGRGLWLKGDGLGNLSPVPGSESGIKVYGEQRGAAFSDFNSDGKVDLAISQNDAETKLYLNRGDRRGYRISLQGPAQNSDGVGSAVRLLYSNGEKGPLREIQAGSGYWSQNSFSQVLGAKTNAEVSGIEVHWFDGRTQTVDVTGGQKEFVITYH